MEYCKISNGVPCLYAMHDARNATHKSFALLFFPLFHRSNIPFDKFHILSKNIEIC